MLEKIISKNKADCEKKNPLLRLKRGIFAYFLSKGVFLSESLEGFLQHGGNPQLFFLEQIYILVADLYGWAGQVGRIDQHDLPLLSVA